MRLHVPIQDAPSARRPPRVPLRFAEQWAGLIGALLIGYILGMLSLWPSPETDYLVHFAWQAHSPASHSPCDGEGAYVLQFRAPMTYTELRTYLARTATQRIASHSADVCRDVVLAETDIVVRTLSPLPAGMVE